jgi:hypothetical protein
MTIRFENVVRSTVAMLGAVVISAVLVVATTPVFPVA